MPATVTIVLSVDNAVVDDDIVALVAAEAAKDYRGRTQNAAGTVTVASTATSDITDDPFAGVAPTLTADVESADVEWVEPNEGQPDAYIVVGHNNDTVEPDTARNLAGTADNVTLAPLVATDEYTVTVYARYGSRLIASAADVVTPTA